MTGRRRVVNKQKRSSMHGSKPVCVIQKRDEIDLGLKGRVGMIVRRE